MAHNVAPSGLVLSMMSFVIKMSPILGYWFESIVLMQRDDIIIKSTRAYKRRRRNATFFVDDVLCYINVAHSGLLVLKVRCQSRKRCIIYRYISTFNRYITSVRNTYLMPCVTSEPSCSNACKNNKAMPCLGLTTIWLNEVSPPSKSSFK